MMLIFPAMPRHGDWCDCSPCWRKFQNSPIRVCSADVALPCHATMRNMEKEREKERE